MNEIFDKQSTCVPSNFRFVEKIPSQQSTNMRIPCSIVRAVIHYTDQHFFEIAKLNNLAKLKAKVDFFYLKKWSLILVKVSLEIQILCRTTYDPGLDRNSTNAPNIGS